MIIKIPAKYAYKKTFKNFNFKARRGTIKKPLDSKKIKYAIIAKDNCVINTKQMEVIRQKITKPIEKIH